MPRYIHEEVGKVYRTRKVKTFGDKVKEFFEMIAGGIVIIVIISVVVSLLF